MIIPAYNCGTTLSKAIDSALMQEIPLEVLVLDDCSHENLEDVLKRYQGDSRVRYIRNEKNMGAAATRNKGVSLALGDYVAFLDGDDWWEKGKLKAQEQRLLETGDVLCCTGRRLINAEGQDTGKYIPVKERITYRDLLRHNSINCSSVVLKKEVALEFPMTHEDSHEDYITWLKILQKYGTASGVNKPYLNYRLSTGGKSGNKLHSAGMTFKVYRYMGFGPLKSAACFVSYALHGLWKYR